MATPSKARAVREPEPESRSVADQTIAVLAKHYPRETSYDAGWLEGCACGAWEVETPIWDTDNEVSWALFFQHQAAELQKAGVLRAEQ
jgi:hypothetical protein